jgi:hypothetical protein
MCLFFSGDTNPCPMKNALVEMGALPPLIDMIRIPQKGDEESVRCGLLAINALTLGDNELPKTVTKDPSLSVACQ